MRIRRPSLAEWREWCWEDYLAYFLSVDAAKARAMRQPDGVSKLSQDDLAEFCRPIRERISAMYSSEVPLVSIQMPARNEESELLATLVSYCMLDVEPGVAELIVADNGSADQTEQLIRHCGAKYAFDPSPGMGRARRAAYDAMAPTAHYVWLTDSDARVIGPLRRTRDFASRSTVLRTSMRCMTARPDAIALSTGIVYEYAHWLFRCVRAVAVQLRLAPRVHAWTGPNQFVRRAALDAIGGINPDVPYRAREDHQRAYELARYAKTIGANMLSAATDLALFDPVHHSGRNRGTLAEVLRAIGRGRRAPAAPRDSYGYPVHPQDRIRV